MANPTTNFQDDAAAFPSTELQPAPYSGDFYQYNADQPLDRQTSNEDDPAWLFSPLPLLEYARRDAYSQPGPRFLLPQSPAADEWAQQQNLLPNNYDDGPSYASGLHQLGGGYGDLYDPPGPSNGPYFTNDNAAGSHPPYLQDPYPNVIICPQCWELHADCTCLRPVLSTGYGKDLALDDMPFGRADVPDLDTQPGCEAEVCACGDRQCNGSCGDEIPVASAPAPTPAPANQAPAPAVQAPRGRRRGTPVGHFDADALGAKVAALLGDERDDEDTEDERPERGRGRPPKFQKGRWPGYRTWRSGKGIWAGVRKVRV